MIHVDYLLEIAKNNNIIVDKEDLKPYFLGLYLNLKSTGPIIYLDKDIITNTPLARSILAEELGHHFTTVGNTLCLHKNYINRIKIGKIEYSALRWAGKQLIPDEELIEFAKHNKHNPRIFAERFNVTLEFMVMRLKIFEEESKHITMLRWIHMKETTRRLMTGSFSIF